MVIFMNIDIRKSVIDKIREDDENSIVRTIDESTIANDELILPGLGVMLEIFWNKLNNNLKYEIARIIKESIS